MKSKKLTCYVLMISKTFPAYHPKAGEETGFKAKIKDKLKIHTLRAKYELWKKRFDKIEKGEAYLSVREWEGKPYNSKQVELFRFYKEDGIGIQKLEDGGFSWFVDDRAIALSDKDLAKNDGLEFEDFIDWFEPYDDSDPLAIIHFTDFRYR